ncbi:MAG: hypothetical protein VKO65_05090 [Cyanobacteriota bacterium]|nr:hypothetical protein [Cyanobacteriota bacterium]
MDEHRTLERALGFPPQQTTAPGAAKGWGQRLRGPIDLRPLLVLAVLYGVVQWLPFSIFGWIQNEDGLLEWASVILLTLSGLQGLRIVRLNNQPRVSRVFWLVFALACLIFVGEELSWGERIHGLGIEAVRSVNTQGETNFHNLMAFQKNRLLHLGWAGLGLVLGSANWLLRPRNRLFPDRQLSLYFLIPGLWYLAFELSRSCLRAGACPVAVADHQEIYEFLISLGIALHSRRCLRRCLAEANGG